MAPGGHGYRDPATQRGCSELSSPIGPERDTATFNLFVSSQAQPEREKMMARFLSKLGDDNHDNNLSPAIMDDPKLMVH